MLLIRRLLASGLAAALTLLLATAGLLAWGGQHRNGGNAWAAGARPGATALVLGLALDRQGRPRQGLLGRTAHAARLYHRGEVARLVVSGGVPRAGRTEAQVMRQLLVAAGVPASRIVLEDRSRTTLENFACSRPVLQRLGAGRVMLVTDPWHMTRALLLARRHGLLPEPSPVPLSTRSWLASTAWLLRDTGAYVAEQLRDPFVAPARCPVAAPR